MKTEDLLRAENAGLRQEIDALERAINIVSRKGTEMENKLREHIAMINDHMLAAIHAAGGKITLAEDNFKATANHFINTEVDAVKQIVLTAKPAPVKEPSQKKPEPAGAANDAPVSDGGIILN
jgi:hypothetical protein